MTSQVFNILRTKIISDLDFPYATNLTQFDKTATHCKLVNSFHNGCITDGQILAWTEPAVINTPSGAVTAPDAIVEGSDANTVLFEAAATPTDVNVAVTYAFATDGNPGDVAAISTTDNTGQVTLAAAGTLDYETKQSYVFQIV